jgi:hypothetical protein
LLPTPLPPLFRTVRIALAASGRLSPSMASMAAPDLGWLRGIACPIPLSGFR